MNERSVTCNGCFDYLHMGHMFFLGFVRGQGDVVTVGINSRDYIMRKKGRIPQDENDRMAAIEQLGLLVQVFTEEDPVAFIKRVGPAVHCIGEEYMDNAPEIAFCVENGIELCWVPRVGSWSTSGGGL